MTDTRAKGLGGMSIMAADVLRLIADVGLHALSLIPAGLAFIWLWRSNTLPLRVLAFPAAYVGLVGGFCLTVLALRLALLRKIAPGRYKLHEPEAVRWIVWDSFMRMVHRSFLHRYLDDFGPLRFLYYRALGAKVDATFFFGWDAKITDPWGIEVGRNVMIGSFAVILGHAVEGDEVFLSPVKIGDGATIGARAFIMPGVEIGAGAIVGACSLVPKNTRIPPGEIWAGAPARKIGTARLAAGSDEAARAERVGGANPSQRRSGVALATAPKEL